MDRRQLARTGAAVRGATAAVAVAFAAILASGAQAQTALPSVTVTEAPAKKKQKAAPKPARPTKTVAAPRRLAPPRLLAKRIPRSGHRVATAARLVSRPAPGPSAGAPSSGGPSTGAAIAGGQGVGAATGTTPAVAAARAGEAQARANERYLEPRGPANVTTLTKGTIDALPEGNDTAFDRVLLQVPGVSQDSAASGDLHIRNEHANVQYRINGILLPDGVSGFSQVLDTSFIRTLSLIDGALPAEYGLHTAGIIDIQTRNGADNPGGDVGVYGGSHDTLISTIDDSGVYGRWDYFFTGRFTTNNLGIENPIPSEDAIHDRTRQGRYFAYVSGLLEDGSRVTFMSGASTAGYQIPNSPGQPPLFAAYGVTNFNSANLNENQVEHSLFNVIAWQKSFGAFDSQVSYFQRYSTLHFVPDPVGDLVFNGVASDVTRTSLVNGLQGDNAYRVDARQTIRFGFTGDVENAQAINNSTVLPTDAAGNSIDAPFGIDDAERKTGLVGGVYLQDEYRLTRELTLTTGLRFDAMQEYVTTNQLSPRIGITYKPFETTTFHAGYARYFTPPELALSAPTPLQAFTNTTGAAAVMQDSPVRPERSHYFDVGVDQQITPHFSAGLDGYYKIAKNLLDDGQFGQALVLTAFNYDHAYNDGVELKLNYQQDGFHAYGNLAVAQQRAKEVTSNQYLFDPDELAYISNNYIYTDHDQLFTVSGGASYTFAHSTLSTDVIYGSGLRNGFANTGTVSPYTSVNLGLTHDFFILPNGKPTTVRFTVVNLLDDIYEIRDGSGIGVFAPQYGARRGVFAGVSQRF